MDVVASQDVELEDVAVKKVPDFGAGCRCTNCQNTQDIVHQEEDELVRIER